MAPPNLPDTREGSLTRTPLLSLLEESIAVAPDSSSFQWPMRLGSQASTKNTGSGVTGLSSGEAATVSGFLNQERISASFGRPVREAETTMKVTLYPFW